MSELQCPVCRSDSFLNPNIKIFISPCFHKICEQCLYKIFAHGYAPCPTCHTQLRRINFISSTFEDIEVEREIKIRKLMSRNFSRTEDEFESVSEYNDYLEHHENIVFELLDLKNDAAVKESINHLKNTDAILMSNIIQQKDENTPNVKRIKIEASDWCMFNEIQPAYDFINEDVTIPSDFMVASEPSGFNKRIILDFIGYSLLQA